MYPSPQRFWSLRIRIPKRLPAPATSRGSVRQRARTKGPWLGEFCNRKPFICNTLRLRQAAFSCAVVRARVRTKRGQQSPKSLSLKMLRSWTTLLPLSLPPPFLPHPFSMFLGHFSALDRNSIVLPFPSKTSFPPFPPSPASRLREDGRGATVKPIRRQSTTQPRIANNAIPARSANNAIPARSASEVRSSRIAGLAISARSASKVAVLRRANNAILARGASEVRSTRIANNAIPARSASEATGNLPLALGVGRSKGCSSKWPKWPKINLFFKISPHFQP
jgi:hypothetical protein